MDLPPEDQNSQQGQGVIPMMSAPSCIIPPLEQLIIRPHIVPLLPNFHGMESENPYAHIKEFEEVYVSEVSRGWDEPNSREKGKFPSQPTQNPKGGMYVLSEDMDMKAKVATIARRLEELEPNNNAPYGNTYNSSWRNHPNFSWKPRPPPYQPQGQTQIDNIQYSISRLTNLNTVNEKGKFPSQPSQNPKGVHEVETQEGEQDEELMSKKTLVKESNNQEEKSGKKSASKSSIEEEPRIVIKEDMMKKHMPPPFPQALHGKKEIKNSSEILEVLRQVKVNIPLLEMIKQVPTYAKFLKDLCTVKRGLHVTKNAFLTEQVSAIIQSKSPVKYKDPGCPTISVNIGGTHVEKAFLDLGQVSVKIPRGVIEDVLLQVDKFYYPVDFVVLDTDPIVKEANYVPIILGRPFLATSNAIINCRNGVMQLTFGNMTLELNIFHLCKRHLHPKKRKDWRRCA
ncbi:hypothetical protein AAG906_017211 [Vitis piasezkii]